MTDKKKALIEALRTEVAQQESAEYAEQKRVQQLQIEVEEVAALTLSKQQEAGRLVAELMEIERCNREVDCMLRETDVAIQHRECALDYQRYENSAMACMHGLTPYPVSSSQSHFTAAQAAVRTATHIARARAIPKEQQD